MRETEKHDGASVTGDLLWGKSNGDGGDRSGGVAVTGGLGEEDLNQVGSGYFRCSRPGRGGRLKKLSNEREPPDQNKKVFL